MDGSVHSLAFVRHRIWIYGTIVVTTAQVLSNQIEKRYKTRDGITVSDRSVIGGLREYLCG